MDESALDIEGLTLSPQKEVVRVFYKECGTTQISDSYALAPSITLNPGLEPDRLQQENASSSGMGNDGKYAQQRWRAGHIRFGSRLCEKSHEPRARRIVFSIVDS